MHRILIITTVFALMLLVAAPAPARAAEPRKIVLVAGTPSHGYGAHEFNAGCLLLERELKRGLGDAIDVKVYLSGWPKDEHAFDGANAIVLYMDGGGGHPVLKHLGEIDKLMSKGVGLMCMHYAVEIPKGEGGDAFKKWIGGYYESDWSINPHWTAVAKLNSKHPTTRGVKPFEVRDEWYFNMRFRDDMKGVTSILQAVPDDEARSGSTSWPRGPKKHIVEASGRVETLMWAVERPDHDGIPGGRGVGFTGGHFHWNWGNPDYRKLVLNTMLWVAGGEVPEGGVPVSPITLDDLKANQDFKPKPDFDFAPIEKDLKKWSQVAN